MTRAENAKASAATEAHADTEQEAGERAQPTTGRPQPRQLSLVLAGVPEPKPVFDGATVEPTDVPRLTGQLLRVHSVMVEGRWYTLAEIAAATLAVYGTTDSEAGISARLRDFRKPRWGSHLVHRRRRDGGAQYEYMLELQP